MRTLTTRRLAITLCALSGGLLDCQCGPNDLGQDPARTEVVRGGDPSTTSSAPLFPIRYGARIGDTVADEGFVGDDGTLFITFNRHGAIDSRRYETYSETEEGTFLHASTLEGLLSRPRLIAPREARVGMTWRADTGGDGEFEFELEVLSKDEEQPTPWGDATVWIIVERNMETGFEFERRFVEGRGLWRRGALETLTPLDAITPPNWPEASRLELEALAIPSLDEDGEPVLIDALENAAVTELSILDLGALRVLLVDYNRYDVEAGIELDGTRRCLLLGEDDALLEPTDDERARLCPGHGLHAGEVLGDEDRVWVPQEEPYRLMDHTGHIAAPFHDDDSMGVLLHNTGIETRTRRDGDLWRNGITSMGSHDWTAHVGNVARVFTLESAPAEDTFVGILGHGNELATTRLHQPGSSAGPMLEFATPRGVLMGTTSTSSTLATTSTHTRLTSTLRDARIVDIDPSTGAHSLLGRARLPEGHTPLMATRLGDDNLILATFSRGGEGIGKTYLWRAAVETERASDVARHPIFSAHIDRAIQGAVVCWAPSEREVDVDGWTLDGEEPLITLLNARGDCVYLASRTSESTRNPDARSVVATLPWAGRVRLTKMGDARASFSTLLDVYEFEHFRSHNESNHSELRGPRGEMRVHTLFEDLASPGGNWLSGSYSSDPTDSLLTARPGEAPQHLFEFGERLGSITQSVDGGGLFRVGQSSPENEVFIDVRFDGEASEVSAPITVDGSPRLHLGGGGLCWRTWTTQDDASKLMCQERGGEAWHVEGVDVYDDLLHFGYLADMTVLIRPGELLLYEQRTHLFHIDTESRSGRSLKADDESMTAMCVTSDARALANIDGTLTWVYPERATAQLEGSDQATANVRSCQELAPGVFWLDELYADGRIARIEGAP